MEICKPTANVGVHDSLQRCFSANGGLDAVWYDGSLHGQFTAARYSGIAANSQSGSKTRVYFQDDKDQIRELYKEGGDTFDPFVLVERTRPAALKGTRIATDSNVNGAPEVYYQSPTLDWVLDGAGGSYHLLTLESKVYCDK